MRCVSPYLISFFMFFCIVSNSFAKEKIKLPKSTYQDIIINNKVVKKGYGPDCQSRYNAIKNVLKDFKRPITVLDIGAAEGYMSFRIANDFDSTCVMIADPGTLGKVLPKLCRLNSDLDNIILLSKRINVQELEILSQCEHFDVVLALNVLHHFSKDTWKRAAEAILSLGDYVIIETPPVEDRVACGQSSIPEIFNFVEDKKETVIAKTQRKHTNKKSFGITYLLKGNKVIERRKSWCSPFSYQMHSSLAERFLWDGEYKFAWPKGISLTTFEKLNGTYPEKNTIQQLTYNFEGDMQHIILQGNQIDILAN